MRKICLFLFLITFKLSQAQDFGTVKGIVKFQEKGIESVNIGISDLGIGTYSNKKGFFELKNIPAGKQKITISALGYKAQYLDINIDPNTTSDINVVLERSELNLNEVLVIDQQTGLTNITPYSISRINAKDIELKGNPSGLMGIMREDPAVYGAEMGQGIVKPFIRGLGFSRVVTIYQGNKLENHQWGADHGLAVSDIGIRNVEIIKGPSSILYGSGAIGGVLLIKDDEPYKYTNEITGTIGTSFNSVSNGFRPNISLGKSFENGFFVAGDLGYENHADYKDGNGRIIGNSRFNTENLRLHTGINKKNFQNKLSYTYMKQNLGIIEDDEMDDEESLATTRNDRSMQLPYQDITDHIISYQQTTQHGKWNTALNLSMHHNTRNEIEDDFDDIDLGLIQSHVFYNARVSHKTNEKLENTFGAQGSIVNFRNNDKAEEILIPDANYLETGVYYLANLKLGKTFIQGGIRYDNRDVNADANAPNLIDYGFILPGNPSNRKLSSNFSGWTGSLGLSQPLGEKNLLKFNFSTGFRAPDLAELYSNGPHPGTNRFEVGSPDFKREQSYQADVNWIFETGKFQSSLAVFGNQVDNYIYFAGTGEMLNDGLEVWAFLQTNAILYGTELEIRFNALENNRLSFIGTANLIKGLDLDNDRPLTFIPPNNFTARAQFRPFKQRNTLAYVSSRYVAKQDRPGLNEENTGMYFLLNAGISHDINFDKNTLSVGLSAFNLLNRTYTDHMSILRAFNIPSPGRNILLNIQWRF